MEHVLEVADPMALTLFATTAGRPLYAKVGFTTIGLNTSYVGQFREHGSMVSELAGPRRPRRADRTGSLRDRL